MEFLRKNKNNIDENYNQIYEEVQMKKKMINNTIKKANRHYKERDKAEEDLKLIQKQANEQKQNFELRMKDLEENLEKDKKFKKFIRQK